MNKPSVHIMVVDDHSVVREGLTSIIRREPGFKVIGDLSNGAEAVEAYDRLMPEVTVMDLRMPVLGGVDAITQIRRKHPYARILVLSNSIGDEDIHLALEAGAMGYLFKHSSIHQIVPAIHALVEGREWIPAEVTDQLNQRESAGSLTSREREIVHLLMLGEANKEIGDALGITEQTVKSHLRNILSKLQVRDRTEAVTVALRRGIIHLPEA